MKVKDLIKKLEQMDPEANVVSQEYTGCYHTIHDVEEIQQFEIKSKICKWDGSSNSKAIDKNGFCKTKVVYLN